MICNFCDTDQETQTQTTLVNGAPHIKNGARIAIQVFNLDGIATLIVYNLCNNCREVLSKVIPAQILAHNLRKNYHGQNPDYRVQRKKLP